MSTTTGLPRSVDVYLEALRAELADLAPEERDDLLSEVEPSLLEAAGDDDEPVAAKLGPAADFAADLRASAGLPPKSRPAPRRGRVVSSLRGMARRPAVVRSAGVLRELAPVWWVARAYVVVEALAMAMGSGAQTVAETSRYALVPRIGGPVLGVVILALAVVASIAAGLAARRNPGRARRGLLAANVVLAVLAVPVAAQVRDAADTLVPAAAATIYEPAVEAPAGLAYDGLPVENVYPYDRQGRLLHDVRLYDGRGRPLDVGSSADARRRPVRDGFGAVLNAFPIRYFERGTRRVARPNAGPRISAPRLTTPPLAPR